MQKKENYKFKKFLIDNIPDFLLTILVIAVPLGIILILSKIITKATDIIAYYGFCFTIFSVLYAAIQFRSNHDTRHDQ